MAKDKKGHELDMFLFHEGTSSHAYEFLGAHWTGEESAIFRVWAPNAKTVSVVGDFNCWSGTETPLKRISEQGVWEGTAVGVREYDSYKFQIVTATGAVLDKCDPYAIHCETRPGNASKLYRMGRYQWQDAAWQKNRDQTNWLHQPINIYELHLGSWRCYPDGNPFSYRKLAEELVPYVKEMGYTHVELMPVTEFPFDGSWGYQVTGYFAATSRFGTPDDLMALIDACHQAGIGVIMDWVPAHFPKDAHGLARFDGECCYEYADARKGEHYEWGTYAFDYGRTEVISFLVSSAMFWVKEYHIDGIRVDAVASMLYLDYGRKDGEWQPNINGGKENLEAVALLRRLNSAVLTTYPGVLMIAEESTSWPLVTKPDYSGGLGFTLKWNMGWMNDSLTYATMDPYFRSYNHDKLTFGMFYAFSENFILPISHDEVVHGKASLLNKMPGDYAQKFAGLRVFLGYMMSFPGKKLTFMGTEFGQFIEWDYQKQLDWMLLEYDTHRQTQSFVRALNHFYREHPQFWQVEDSWDGYRWLNADDNTRNVIAYLRASEDGRQIAVVCNFAPVEWADYQLGVPEDCTSLKLLLHSDWEQFGGATVEGTETLRTKKGQVGEFHRIATMTLPPFSMQYFEVKHKEPPKADPVAKKLAKAELPKAAPVAKKPAKTELPKAAPIAKKPAKTELPKAALPAEKPIKTEPAKKKSAVSIKNVKAVK
ncbi:MAG: 1,4-alpha-glucan branching protein GlgB [Angelakisella sp.]